MLDSITIKNFKAIGNDGLTLNNLSNVNYLVGKNGCGKSTILDYIHLSSDYCRNHMTDDIKTMFFSEGELQQFREIESESMENLIGSSYLIKDIEIKPSDVNSVARLTSTGYYGSGLAVNVPFYDRLKEYYGLSYEGLIFQYTYFSFFYKKYFDTDKKFIQFRRKVLIPIQKEIVELSKFVNIAIDKDNFEVLDDNNPTEQDFIFTRMATGYQQLYKLLCFLYVAKNNCYVLLDEPEIHLHPEIQKLLPKILNFFSKQFSETQFFISTHSPFIISEAGKYPETQNVYLIKDGQTVDLENNLGKGQDGFSGYEMKEVANEKLGATSTDFIFKTYIFCEGETNKKNRDSVIYNKIFQPYKDVKFISDGSFTKAKANIKIKHILPLLLKDIELFCFLDKDEATKGTKKDLESRGFEVRTTNFSEMESYLYHPSVITIYNSQNNKNLPLPGENPQKDKHLKTYFAEIKNDVDGLGKEDFEIEILAPIIREMGKNQNDLNNIYWQLHNCIFTS